jgi:hypothetical protein
MSASPGRFATEHTVARLGDEFAILRSQADAVTAEQLAMRVGESLRRPSWSPA